MKIIIIISSNDSETVWNAFRLANTSLKHNDQVNVFLIGKGVEAAAVSTLKFDIREQMDLFRNADGSVFGCGVCCEIRKEEMPFLQEELKCEIGSMEKLYGLIAEADKVITF